MSRANMIYSINPVRIAKFIGYPICMLGLAGLVPFFASLFFKEWSVALPYFCVALFSLVFGFSLTHIRVKGAFSFNDAIATICITYLYASFTSSIPLMFAGLSFSSAFFEAVSGITTTGLSVIHDYETIPRTTLFARSWLQWVGGIGIVIFSLVFLIEQGSISKKLNAFSSDTSDIVGSSKVLAKGIVIVYCLLTLVGIIVLYFLSYRLYDAILLVFAAVSTGGFSPFAGSLETLSSLEQVWITILSFVCAISLPFYFKIWNEGINFNLQGVQVIGLLAAAIFFSLVLGGSFNDWILGFSSQTTAGFSSSDPSLLAPVKKIALSFSMLLGGGVGSTAGGFKILRLFLFFGALKTLIIQKSQAKHAYYKPTLFGYVVSDGQFQQAMILIILYTLVTFLSWICFIAMDYSVADSLFEVTSALGTVGLSVGISQPTLPLFLKSVLCIDMLLGRLEIFPWLIVLFPKNFISQQLETK